MNFSVSSSGVMPRSVMRFSSLAFFSGDGMRAVRLGGFYSLGRFFGMLIDGFAYHDGIPAGVFDFVIQLIHDSNHAHSQTKMYGAFGAVCRR